MSMVRLRMWRMRGIIILTRGKGLAIVCDGGGFDQRIIDACRTRAA